MIAIKKKIDTSAITLFGAEIPAKQIVERVVAIIDTAMNKRVRARVFINL